jgi:TRAP-type C4-dicarboxylate transport system substrate-binding protein
MRLTGWLVLILCLPAAVAFAAADVSEKSIVSVAVVAPSNEEHFAWAAATRLQLSAKERGIDMAVSTAPVTDSPTPLPTLVIMPTRSLATQVPELQILELPFFYPSLGYLHDRLDHVLGTSLAEEARKRNWEIVAYWDEGMHVMSGIRRYDRVGHLRAMEFLITRPDPVAEKQFIFWEAYNRQIRPEDKEAVLRECLIASRAATLQEIVREQLYRVHLTVALTHHRYEGWVVVAPLKRWSQLEEETKVKLSAVLRETTAWQREDAREREAAALAELKRRGMIVHEVDAEEREAFRKALPDWADLLSDELDTELKRKLIELASAGAAVVPSPGDPATAETLRDPVPGAPAR